MTISLIILELWLFFTFFILSLYIVFIAILSKGFSTTPTISSPRKSTTKIIEYLNLYINSLDKKEIKIIDFGSGYGGTMFRISKKLDGKIGDKKLNIIGYEICKIPYKISNILNNCKNVKIINEDINNIKNFDCDIVTTFFLAKQQKNLLDIYRKLPKNTIIIANSIPIPFENDDKFKLINKINVTYGWNIFVYGQ